MKSKSFLTIRDAVHGDIEIYDKVAIKLINSSDFQRLRRISQLAGGQYVFPSAYHNRFSHCLGVYHIICEIISTSNFSDYYTERQQLIVKLAGLLHDIGHGPFSHTFEMINFVTKTNISHEQYSTLLITSPDTEINQILSETLTKEEILELCQMIEGNHPDPVISSLVSSQVDADRLDYLMRDSLTSGVSYSHLDLPWIIRHLKIKDNKIVFPQKVCYALESYLTSRYHMYKQIYLHPVSIGFDLTFQMLFRRLYDLYHQGYQFKQKWIIDKFVPIFEGKMLTSTEYTQLDDYQCFTYLKMLSDEQDGILQNLIQMFLNRNFLRMIDPHRSSNEEIKIKLQNQYKNDYNYFMVAYQLKPIGLYKTDDKPIYIETATGVKTLDEVSDILRFASPTESQPAILYFTIPEMLK